MGIDNTFLSTQRWHSFCTASQHLWNPQLSSGPFQQVLDSFTEYRTELRKSMDAKGGVLGDGFWFYVYNDPHCRREKLESYFQSCEVNPVLIKFPTEHKAGLDFLFLRLAFVHSSKKRALWYVFWDDVWGQNSSSKLLQPWREDLDPMCFGTSIAYNEALMNDETALIEWLKTRDMYGGDAKEGGCKTRLTRGDIALLFQHMNVVKNRGGILKSLHTFEL